MQRLYWALLCTNSIEGEMSDSQSLMFVLYIVFLHANQFGWSGFPWMTVLSLVWLVRFPLDDCIICFIISLQTVAENSNSHQMTSRQAIDFIVLKAQDFS